MSNIWMVTDHIDYEGTSKIIPCTTRDVAIREARKIMDGWYGLTYWKITKDFPDYILWEYRGDSISISLEEIIE